MGIDTKIEWTDSSTNLAAAVLALATLLFAVAMVAAWYSRYDR